MSKETDVGNTKQELDNEDLEYVFCLGMLAGMIRERRSMNTNKNLFPAKISGFINRLDKNINTKTKDRK